MALTLLDSPNQIVPAWNPIPYVLSSTNIAQENFRYILELYKRDGFTLLTTVTAPPDPNGYGVFNMSKIMSAYMSANTLDTGFCVVSGNPEQACFQVKFRESYTPYITLNGVTDSAVPQSGFDLQFSSTTGFGSTFAAGDEVEINISSPPALSVYNGIYTIVSLSSNQMVVNAYWQGGVNITSAITTGVIVSATRQRTDQPIQTSINWSGCCVNAAIDTCDWTTYSKDYYDLQDGGTKSWFANFPNPFVMRLDNIAHFNLLSNTFSGLTVNPNVLYIDTYNSSNTLLGTYTKSIINTVSGTGSFYYVPAGPYNLTQSNAGNGWSALSGALPIISNNVSYYEIYLTTGFATRKTTKQRIYIDRTCYKWDNIELLFLDRYGNYCPFNFSLVSRKTTNVTRNSFKKGLGQVTTKSDGVRGSVTTWDYTCQDRGISTLNNIIDVTYTLQTDWLKESMAQYFEELLTSPVVFMKIDGIRKPAQLVTNSLEIVNKTNTRLLQYSIQVKLGVTPIVQMGI